MRIHVVESEPGELAATSAPALRAKLAKAFGTVLAQAGVEHGGEVLVVDELADMLAKAYDRRRTQLLADVVKAVVDGR